MEWLSFDLHPEYPPEGISRADLERRYGSSFSERLHAMFAEAGLPYAPHIDKVPNSRKALALSELARDQGRHDDIHPRLFDAYWGRGLDIGADEVLLAEGAAVGLEEDDMRRALVDPAYIERIEAQTTAATDLGAGGVPAWVIDQRFLVPGAQPHDVFERVLIQLGHEPIET